MTVTSARIDWFRVITDLNRSGLSDREIGEAIGRSQQQVNTYKVLPETEPRFHVGMLLLGLWQGRCSDRVASAPTLD